MNSSKNRKYYQYKQFYQLKELSYFKRKELYKKINETSNYPVSLLYIDQDFTTRIIPFYLVFKELYTLDVTIYILKFLYYDILYTPFIYVDNMNDDSIYKERSLTKGKINYECTKCIDMSPSLIKSNKEIGDLFNTVINKFKYCNYHTYNNNNPKTIGCLDCVNIEGSLYCEFHLNCDICGLNRRFTECECYNKNIRTQKYKMKTEFLSENVNNTLLINNEYDEHNNLHFKNSNSRYIKEYELDVPNKLTLKPTDCNIYTNNSVVKESLSLIDKSELKQKYEELVDIIGIQTNMLEIFYKDMIVMQNKLEFIMKLNKNANDLIKNNNYF